MPKNWRQLFTFLLAFAYAIFVLCYKLDAHYMFTDEVLYVQAGREYIKGDYTLNLQHPLLGKYISAITSVFSNDVFLLRLPYALIGLVSAFVVFKILSLYYEFKISILGLLFYSSLPFLNYTNRSILLDSPMHLFWLLCSYFILKFSVTKNLKYFYISAVFLGLSFSTKYTSVVLMPGLVYVFLVNRKMLSVRHILLFIFIFTSVYFLHYVHLFIKYGFFHFTNILRAMVDVFIKRNTEGKIHVIDGVVHKFSPWWFYLHYIKEFYNPVLFLGFVATSFIGFVKGRLSQYIKYWAILAVFVFIFIQSLSLKNYRYLSSFELPLIFLFVEGVRFFQTKFRKFYVLFFIVVPIGLFIAINRQPNSYHKAYLYLSEKTNNFSSGERILIFGSFRSARWYFTGPQDIVVVRKDVELFQDEVFSSNFRYILVDNTERAKYPDSILFTALRQNIELYKLIQFDNLTLYELIN